MKNAPVTLLVFAVLVLATVMAQPIAASTAPETAAPAVHALAPAAQATAAPTPAPATGGPPGTRQEPRQGHLRRERCSSPDSARSTRPPANSPGSTPDYCRAVAAAVLGDPKAVEFRPLNTGQRGPALQTGEIDVLIRNTTWTVSRDDAWGLFAPTTFYDGQGMMVKKSLGVKKLADLKGASICVQSGTTTELNLTDQMRAAGVDFKPVVFADIDPTYNAFEQGRCDAVTSDKSQLASRRTAFKTPADYEIMDLTLSKEPLGPAVPLGDDQWYNVVKWTVFATFQADEWNVTSKTVDEALKSTNPDIQRFFDVNGDLFKGLGLNKGWAATLIKAVGNYSEIYDRNLGPATPLNLPRGLNKTWGQGGILYAPPYR